jgi:hypothetical protein
MFLAIFKKNFNYIAVPVNIPFKCDFDSYSTVGGLLCNGISYDDANTGKVTGLDVDFLPGTTKTITDYTSIGKTLKIFKGAFLFFCSKKAGKTQSYKNCNIPFLYQDDFSYFCVLNQSRFVCETDKSNEFDYCILGKKIIFVFIYNHFF